MAVTTTTRFGITRWSSGADLFTRVHMDDSHAAIESKGAIYLQGLASARPTAGIIGRFYYATDTAVFTYDDGVAWVNVSSPDTVTLTATQTLTNKTLTSPVINGTVTGTAAFTGVTGIATPEYVTFDQTHTQTDAIGKVLWNDFDGTLNLGLKRGNVVLQVGQQLFVPCRNNTGSQILKGRAVYVNGALGDRKTIAQAQANSETTSSKTLGLLAETTATGSDGFVITKGVLRGLNTDTFTIGNPVWLSPTNAGELTQTRPAAPNNAVFIGWVTRVHQNQGEIYVDIQNGYELDELHDVLITSPVANNTLVYDGTKWINKTIASMLDGITLTGTITLPSTTSIGNVSATELGYLDGVTSALQTQLNARAPLASPALTGTPTAPTAAVDTNTTQVATTAFVVSQIADDAPTKTGTGASGTWGISITGNSATATKLATARTISLTGDVTGSASFDGSANISINAVQDSQPFVATFMMAGL